MHVTAEQDVPEGEHNQWDRIYFPACDLEEARPVKALIGDLWDRL